ncbi:hypothetical protein SCHPADRAFT_946610 [Schizopora paradoxa]|uniref:Uncharacterized protein n=1 Tax=Schizopora paradoxa TaxID=27342 RepID=A0A0H2R8F1_9AGAM|nr:hypothetical protein SCHPADRAFT_946610 [Schizopora paradoxa]
MAQIFRNIKAKLKGGQRRQSSSARRLHGGAVAPRLPLDIDTVPAVVPEEGLTFTNSQTFTPNVVEFGTDGSKPIIPIRRPMNDRSPHEVVRSSIHERLHAIQGVVEIHRRESPNVGLSTAMDHPFSASQAPSEMRSRFYSQPHIRDSNTQNNGTVNSSPQAREVTNRSLEPMPFIQLNVNLKMHLDPWNPVIALNRTALRRRILMTGSCAFFLLQKR